MSIAEIVIRFLIGGLVVSLFSLLGDLLRPKSFAGVFGAAPSVALATLGLTIARKGSVYAGIEARSMMIGAIAFGAFAWATMHFLMRSKASFVTVLLGSGGVWFLVAFGLRFTMLH